MKLVDGWPDVLKRAWSIRLAIIAAICTGAATILPIMGDVMNPWGLLVAAVVANALIPLVRLLQQPGLHKSSKPPAGDQGPVE